MLTNTLEEQMTNDKISWNFFLSDISSVFTTFPYFLKRKQQAFPPTIRVNIYVALFKKPVGTKGQLWLEGRVQIFSFSSVDESISASLSRMAS